MPQVTIPDKAMPGIKAALGEDAAGLTDKQAAVEWAKRSLRSHMRQVGRQAVKEGSAVIAAKAALEAKIAAEAAATLARVNAEVAADALVETDLAGVK